MHFSDLIGSLGVALLLLAFLLNLFRYITQESLVYILLNISGAGLSGYASWLIHYTPFIVLEGCWCLVAIIALVRSGHFFTR